MKAGRLFMRVWMACLLAVGLAGLGSATAAAADQSPLAGLEDYVTTLMEITHVPGVAVAVTGPQGKVLVLQGYGLREQGKRGRVDADTVFAIGSMTKNFTATALGLLVDEGALSWEQPLTRFVPGLRFSEPYLLARLSLLDALSHRTGLQRADMAWFANSGAARQEMVAIIEHIPPEAAFRASYLYNNFMYLAAGQAIPAASGESWDTVIQQRLLQPLQMRRTSTSAAVLDEMKNVARPHLLTRERAIPADYYNLDHLGPAGSINSTARDMANWCHMQLADGQFGGRQVVPPAVLDAVRQPQNLMPLSESGHAGNQHKAYALGLERMNYGDGHVLYTHGGAINGMSSNLAFVPEAGYCVVVLTNGATGTRLRYHLTDWILDRLLGESAAAGLDEFTAALDARYDQLQAIRSQHEQAHKAQAAPGLALHLLAGRYTHELYGDLMIEYTDGVLYSRYGRGKPSRLDPHGPLVFDLVPADASRAAAQPAPPSLSFSLDQNRQPESVLLQTPGPGSGIRFRAEPDPDAPPGFDLVIANGTVYDGSGAAGVRADVGIRGDRIAAVGDLSGAHASERIDASGKAVTPGFINMLSHGADQLIHDGRGVSDIAQGVTLEVFGEGGSMGPLSERMKTGLAARQGAIKYAIEWSTLGGLLDYLADRGVSPNIASYVGATTLRIKHLGFEDRPPRASELQGMQADVAVAMEEGAMGVSTALIYAPGFYAETDELIALVDVAEDYGGSYITHMRSEGVRLLEGVDEVLRIARATGAAVEIHHLKAAGRDNWPKMQQVIERINAARADGIDIRANMYPYVGGSTGLNATMPPWVQEGGYAAWVERLRDPEIRAQMAQAIVSTAEDWENMYVASGGADNILLVDFRNPELQPLSGMSLAEVARLRGTDPAETIMDLVIEDGSRVESVYFMMSEDNLVRQLSQPWVSIQSDAPVLAPEGLFRAQSVHPRAYGTFARIFARYVREQQVIPLEEAVRRLTSLPAANLKIRDRGLLRPGYFADVVVFDPDSIQDHATFTEPHQLSTGVEHVLVNGVGVWRNGAHTGLTTGRVVRGPGYLRTHEP